MASTIAGTARDLLAVARRIQALTGVDSLPDARRRRGQAVAAVLCLRSKVSGDFSYEPLRFETTTPARRVEFAVTQRVSGRLKRMARA